MMRIAERDINSLPLQRAARSFPARQSISQEVVSGTIQALDAVAILAAGLAAFSFYLIGVIGTDDAFDRYSLTAIVAAIIFVFLMRKSGAYAFPRLRALRWQLGRTSLAWAATISMLATLAFVTKVADSYSRGWAISFALLAVVELEMIRVALRLMIRRWKRQGRLVRNVAIIGAGEAGAALIAKLESDARGEVAIAGVFDDRLTRVPPIVAGHDVLGTTDRLIEMAQTGGLDEIIIALPLRAAERIGEIVTKMRLLPIDLRLSIDPIAGGFPMRSIGATGPVPVIEILDRPLKNWSSVAKWLEDKILSALCLVALAPLMGLIALAIRLDSPGPVFFVQPRFGFSNRPVRVIKFRSMSVEQADPSGALRTVPNDPRVTRIGRILRHLSLDELPQLVNVLRGEMSLVGPRPHAMAMKAGDRLYHDAVGEYFHRHRVKPGITGWAQVHGQRGEIDGIDSARRRVAYDLYYIDHWSLWLDCKILFLTLRALLRRQNAY
ncbi:MAG TPA: undecaprenyl-phosphate glucose phosphotransferase [Stellaceae bacterium]|nr:undecaprenyl-phosphate glucose phosphotransferase [Stellaceae bacterium]